MNKQEAIEKLKSEARHHCGEKECYKDGCTKNVELDIAIDIVNQLDEPEKPIIPQFVADYIEENRDALEEYVYSDVQITLPRIQDDNPMHNWLNGKGIGIIVDCIRNGYEVEKEKLYKMKHKLTGEYLCFVYNEPFHSDNLDWYTTIKKTQKEWEDMGYWNNNMYEPKEVLND